MSASMLSRELADASKILWEKRNAMNLVVLIDEDTSEIQPIDSSKTIWILRDALTLVRIFYRSFVLPNISFSTMLIWF